MVVVVTLLLVGAALLLAETVLPGMIAGIVGAGCVLAGVIAGYADFGARTGNFILLAVIVCAVAGFCLWLKYFPDSRMARPFVSHRVVGDIDAAQPELLHATGTAFTRLRPAGTAIINGRRVDVVTEGQLIDPGTPVKVVAIEGMRVVVRGVSRP